MDILPYAGSAVSLVALLDLLLLLLTHKQSTIRRSAYALLLLALYLSTTTLLAVHSYSHRPPRDVTATELKDAISWIPTSSTPAQEAELGRLRTLVESTHSAFDPLPFTPGELKQDPSRSVTAVVLHWKRRKGLQLVLKHISRYPYIREIIIWNNQGGADLLPTVSSFLPATIFRSLVRITGLYPRRSAQLDPRSTLAQDLQLPFERARRRKTFRLHSRDVFPLLLQRRRLAQYLHGRFVLQISRLLRRFGQRRTERDGRRDREQYASDHSSRTSSLEVLQSRSVAPPSPLVRRLMKGVDIDLHTGFTWLGTGSFAPREFSIRFLNQQSAAPVLLRQEQTLVSDMFFSLWTNSYPEQVSRVPGLIRGADSALCRCRMIWCRSMWMERRLAGVVVRESINGRSCMEISSVLCSPFVLLADTHKQLDALRKLHDILAISSPSLVPHPFPSRSPSPESHLRAPCHNDRCLFSTSLTPFPHPSTLVHPSLPLARSFLSRIIPFVKIPASLIITDGRLDPWRIGSVKEVEKRWNEIEGGWPEDKWWIEKGSWHLAVDGKRETCWESWRGSFVLHSSFTH